MSSPTENQVQHSDLSLSCYYTRPYIVVIPWYLPLTYMHIQRILLSNSVFSLIVLGKMPPAKKESSSDHQCFVKSSQPQPKTSMPIDRPRYIIDKILLQIQMMRMGPPLYIGLTTSDRKWEVRILMSTDFWNFSPQSQLVSVVALSKKGEIPYRPGDLYPFNASKIQGSYRSYTEYLRRVDFERT